MEVAGDAIGDTIELGVVVTMGAVDQRGARAVAGDGRCEHRIEGARTLAETAHDAAEVRLLPDRRHVLPVHGAEFY